MTKKKSYSSVGLDDAIYNNPGLLQSDAMKRIEEEQGEVNKPRENEPVVSAAEKNPEQMEAEQLIVKQENDRDPEPPAPEKDFKSKKKDAGYEVKDIFSKDNLSEKDFTSAILHNDILEELHELARIRDDEGKRYPVKYLASNIIRNYLNDHKAEIESLKTEFKSRRS